MKAAKYATIGAFLLFISAAVAGAAEVPPGRVARLQYVSGSVSIQPRGTGGWVTGLVNHAVSPSDNVWTDKNSRAELGVGAGVLRMNGETSMTLTDLSRNTVQVTLHQGNLNLRVFHLFDGEIYEVDTPNVTFTLQKSGEYRFDVDPANDTTIVTVRKGQGDATGEGPAVRVRAHEQARFKGTVLVRNIHQAPRPDGFDSWCEVRDQRQDHWPYGGYGVRVYPPYPYGPYVWVGPGPYRYGPWVWGGVWWR